MIINLHIRHQRLPPWDGHGYQATNISTGGCSSLGVDSSGKFGLVYKATESTGGLYRNFTRNGEVHQQYVKPVHVRHIPSLCEFYFYEFYQRF